MAIIVKGQSTYEKDGKEIVYITQADAAFNSIINKNNKLALSELKSSGLKLDGEFVNTPLYSIGTTMVTKNGQDGKQYSKAITPNRTLKDIEFVKTKYYNFTQKKWVDLQDKIDIFKVTPTVEGLLQLCFPAYVTDGSLTYTAQNEQKTKNKTVEYIIPKNYKSFVRLSAENIKAICANLSIDFDKEMKDAKLSQQMKPNENIYIEQPKVKENIARLYAILESYPNVLPLIPSYIIALPIIQEAFKKGKIAENKIDLESKLEFVKLYDSKTATSKPIFDRISDIVQSNTVLKDKLYSTMSNISDAFGKIDIKFEDIKAEYQEAKESIDHLKTLQEYSVRDEQHTSGLTMDELNDAYGDEPQYERSKKTEDVKQEEKSYENRTIKEMFENEEISEATIIQ